MATYKRIVLIVCALAGVSVSLIAHANFTQTLKEGDTHPEVKQLQQFLNIQGFTVAQTGPGSTGQETETFGPATKAALIRFQETYRDDVLTPAGLTSGNGYFGPYSVAKANTLLVGTTSIEATPQDVQTNDQLPKTTSASTPRYLTQQDFDYLIKRIETERKQSLHIADDIEYRSPIESLTGVTLGNATFEDTDASFDSLSVSGNATFATLSVSATATLPLISVSGFLLGSDYLTDLTGTGLVKSGNSLVVDSTLFFALADWYGTTTDALDEGIANLYYTSARASTTAAAYISASSTIPHVGGTTVGDMLYWTGSSWAITATSTLGIGGANFTGLGTAGMLTSWTSGTGLTATGTPSAAAYIATSSTATSTFAGKVGIGTTNPLAKLDVNGDARINLVTVGRGGGNIVTNTANGYGALLSNTTGANNTANGISALYFNTTGSYNTANGSNVLSSNTTGAGNTANGYGALYFNTTGAGNTANGYGALYFNTTGAGNTANGNYAARGTAGYANASSTYLGAYAGYSASYGSNENTMLGTQSGYSVSTGARNTLVGANAGYTGTALTTGRNNILIGYGVGATSSNMSYGLNIGNLIYGTGLTGTGSTLSTGNIGIGTTTPSQKLTVVGNVYASSFIDDGITLTAPDYVFDDPNYFHLSLADIEASTIANAHLPWLTPRGSGPMALSERINEILEALENLFLHVFDLAKRLVSVEDKNEEQDAKNEEQDAEIEALKAEIRTLKEESNQELLLEPQPVEPAEPESGAGETPQPEPAPDESATPPAIEEDQPEETPPPTAPAQDEEELGAVEDEQEPTDPQPTAPTEDNTTASPDESAEAEPSTEEPQPTAPPA